MGLLDRVLGLDGEKIAVHAFMAALAEYKRGAVTAGQISTAFSLSGDEGTALAEWLTNLDNTTIDRTLIHDVLLLGEAGHYSKAQVKTRLGLTE